MIDSDMHMYCVWAYRYGDTQAYNYPVGAFSSLEKAQKAARNHAAYRGGKYSHRIFLLPIDLSFDAEEAIIIQDTTRDD